MEKENNEKEKAAASKKKKARSWETEKSIVKKIAWLAVIILALAWVDMSVHLSSSIREEKSAARKWQAVFLNNGQVYFGHLARNGFNYWKLSDAYYIQVTKVPAAPQPQPETKPGEKKTETPQQPQEETRTTLVKITSDMHGPENAMFIPSNNILFWQNLRGDSDVVRTITAPPTPPQK